MGGVLGRPPASPRSPPGHCDPPRGPGVRARPVYRVGRVQQVPRAQHVLRARAAPRPRPRPGPGPGPGAPSRAAAASEARLRLRLRRGRDSAARTPPSAGWDSFLRRPLWSLLHPGTVRSPVTVQICPAERRGPASLVSAPAIHCAGPSEPEQRAPRVPEDSDPNAAGAAASPSAFTPLARRGAPVAFVPRPGPLREPLGTSGAAPYAPAQSAAGTYHQGPLSARRNAICSSYSSARPYRAPGKRGLPRFSPEIPEWPLRKREKGHPPPSVTPPAAGTAGRPRRQSEKTRLLPSRPGDPPPETAPPGRGSPVSDEDCTFGKKAGQDAMKASDSTPETWPDIRPSPCSALPFPRTAPTDADPQLGSLAKTTPGPPLSLEDAQSETLLACSPGPTPAAAPRLLGTVMARPAPSPLAARSALFRDLPATTLAAPSTQSTLFGERGSLAPHLPASAPPAAPSTDSLLKPVLGSLPGSEMAGSSDSRVAVAAAASSWSPFCTAPGASTSTFKPVFGSIGALSPVPLMAAFSPWQPSPLPVLAAAHRSLGLVLSTSPAGTSQDPAAQLPRDSSTAVPSSGLTFRLHSGAAGFSPDNHFIFSPQQPPSMSTGHSVTICNQVPSATQAAPGRSAADFRGLGKPLSPLVLVHPHLSTSSLSLSSLTPAPQGVASQPAFGAISLHLGQKQGLPLSAVASSFGSPLLPGNWAVVPPAPMPGPARPVLSISTQAALGGRVLSASTLKAPAGGPMGFAFGQVSPVTGFGIATQRHPSGAGGPAFGSMAPRPFAFGGSVTPMECGEPSVTVTTDRGAASPPGLSGWEEQR